MDKVRMHDDCRGGIFTNRDLVENVIIFRELILRQAQDDGILKVRLLQRSLSELEMLPSSPSRWAEDGYEAIYGTFLGRSQGIAVK